MLDLWIKLDIKSMQICLTEAIFCCIQLRNTSGSHILLRKEV